MTTATKAPKSTEEFYPKHPARRPRTPEEFYRAWAGAILALRRAEQAVTHFGTVQAHTPEADLATLGDPSFEDLRRDIDGIEWQLARALRLLDNFTPPAVALLTGGLESGAGQTPVRKKARRMMREIARRQLAGTPAVS